jgi:hypothetical protein
MGVHHVCLEFPEDTPVTPRILMQHKVKPFQLSEPNRYCRLFPPATAQIGALDARLKCLAWSMCEKEPYEPSGIRRREIPAGYTYFGQFIDHDMTSEDFASLDGGGIREPGDTPNLRSPWLDLDSLYGQGPSGRLQIYNDDGVSFRVGAKLPNNRPFDVPLDECSQKPLVAEHRNLENVIVRQLHAMFLKLHNVAVAELPTSWPQARRFCEARRRVCHQYQWLVRNDFLPRICEIETYRSVLQESMVDWDGRFSIPIEFARAAFRFGHSMVRESYKVGDSGNSIPLHDLFGGKDSVGALVPEKHAVPWSLFLGPHAGEFAMHINTAILSPLFHIPGSAARLFTRGRPNDEEIVLPHVTLQRGAASRLLSGQSVCHLLQAQPIAWQSVGYHPWWRDAETCGLREQTPLWYYILLEAEARGGRCLGAVGSRIVGEVIEAALWANKASYLRMYGRYWKPNPWIVLDGHVKREIQVETLHDVAIIVGLAEASDSGIQ